MRLPNGHRATIDRAKLVDYLLSETHPNGRFKAAFFKGYGFSAELPDALGAELAQIARAEEFVETGFRFGRKYAGSAEIDCPSGAKVLLTTVWVILTESDVPVFVTAYPA